MPIGDTQWIMGLAGKYAVLDIAAIFLAQYLGYIFGLIFLIALLLEQDVRRRVYVLCISGLSLILSMGIIRSALNYFLYRPRPFVAYDITPLIPSEATASFPSGHATLFFTLAALVFLYMSRRFGIWAFVVAGLISLARVYVGVHYPLDILGGALIGALSPFLIRVVLPARLAEPARDSA